MADLMPIERIENMILTIRDQKVIVDRDLAYLYGVSTKVFNQAIRRNQNRFPEKFMFQLIRGEKDELVTNCDRFNKLKHSVALPFVFTEYGALMSANVLNSDRAVQISILVVEAFVRMRREVMEIKTLAKKIDALEAKYDQQFKAVFTAVKQLMAPPPGLQKPKIGFQP
jgi:hypothetical protein